MYRVSTSERPCYSAEQIQKYFSHISLPQSHLHYKQFHNNPKDALDFLTQLQKHQLATVPFENLQLHYSTHHSISLDPEYLYTKIVEKGNRGGYCMENNCFFGTVLRTLGFTLHSAGARVAIAASGTPAKGYFGWYYALFLSAEIHVLIGAGHIW